MSVSVVRRCARFALVSLAFLLTACAPIRSEQAASPPASGADTAIVVTDALGRTVRLAEPPQRIVLAGRATIMVADAVYTFPGVGARIVGMSDTSQGDVSFIELLDPTFGDKLVFPTSDVTAEEIAATQPDLVIAKRVMASALQTPLEQLGIPTLFVDLETPEQYSRDLGLLGQVLGQTARADELVARYENEVAAVAQQLGALDDAEKPRTLLLYYSDRGGEVAFNVAPASWMQTRLVEMGGGTPVWTDVADSGGWTVVNLEQIAAWDPDVIVIVHYRGDSSEIAASLVENATWQQLRAVQEGRIYGFPADFYSWDQPDVRWTLGLRWLANTLHPDRMGGFDVVAEMQRFYADLYGLDAATVETTILPALQGSVE